MSSLLSCFHATALTPPTSLSLSLLCSVLLLLFFFVLLADKEGEYIHVNWTGRGGNVSSLSYNV
jgi:hypothetical protein